MHHIVIVGGGISGLACARDLLDSTTSGSVQVTVLEAAPVPGGPVRSERVDGFVVEAGPHGFVNSDPSTAALARRVGLGERLVPAHEGHRGRFIFHSGRLHRFPAGPVRLLTSQLLSWRGRARLLVDPRQPRHAPPPQGEPTDPPDESVGAFARRRLGDEVAERLVDPLVCGIYGGDMDRLSLSSAAPQLAAMIRAGHSALTSVLRMTSGPRPGRRGGQQAHRAGAAGSAAPRQLVSFIGGIGELTDALAESLGPALECGTAVTGVARSGAGWSVEVGGAGPRRIEADAVILAVPAPAARSLLGSLDADLARTLSSVRYLPDVTVALGLRAQDVAHTLDGFGYLVPRSEGGSVLGVLWSSSMFPGHRSPEGTVLMQAILGGVRHEDVCQQTDQWLEEQVVTQLRSAIGLRGAPIFRRVVRHPTGLPQYEVGHRQRVALVEASERRHPGLFLTGNAYRGVGINACTTDAAQVTSRVLAHLGVAAADLHASTG